MSVKLTPFEAAYILLCLSFLVWVSILLLLNLRDRKKNEAIFRKLMEKDDEPPYAF